MKDKYVFRFDLNGRPIFEKDSVHFVNTYVDESHLAVGLCTDDPEGFAPIESRADYEKVQEIAKINEGLNKITIVGIEAKFVIVAIDYKGEYEYFKSDGCEPSDITDEMSIELAMGIDTSGASSFDNPYIADFKNKELQYIK